MKVERLRYFSGSAAIRKAVRETRDGRASSCVGLAVRNAGWRAGDAPRKENLPVQFRPLRVMTAGLPFSFLRLHPVAVEFDFENPAGVRRNNISQYGELWGNEAGMLGLHSARHIGAQKALRLWAGVFSGSARRHGALTSHRPFRTLRR